VKEMAFKSFLNKFTKSSKYYLFKLSILPGVENSKVIKAFVLKLK
jgi:hypothetical protein